MICEYSARILVGRRHTTQSMDGSSYPSVSSIALVRMRVSSRLNRSSVACRSVVWPSTCSANNPRSRQICAKRFDTAIKRQEHERLAVPVFHQHIRDLFEIRFERMAEVIGAEIARRGAHAAKVHSKRHGLHPDRREPSLVDQIEQGHLAGDVLEVAAEVLLVATVRRRA